MFATLKRLYTILYPPEPKASADSKPLRFGILGAANIAPPALIIPAKSHPDVVVYAVAARSLAKAEAFAKKYGIAKAYEGYQQLLDDPEVDVVYNPLPNGLHYEWTMKALARGKHVLLEKPAANTAKEMQKMFELAESKSLVLVEAFHYRFHPAIQRVKEILDSGELGRIKSITVNNCALTPFGEDDIRYQWDLGGGALMDMGCYTVNCLRYLASSDPIELLSASCTKHIPKKSLPSYESKVDRATTATLSFPNDIIGTINCDLSQPWKFGGLVPPFPEVSANVECEGGDIRIFNFVLPTLYHSITVKKRDGKKVTSRTEKVYKPAEGKGEEWWLTYRYQLEAFVDRVRGREPQTWVTKEDSVANMEWIEKIYEKSGVGLRPKSQFVP
ncbi:hypothetical protein VNI00_002810 [Paramarasmius palmivorus]|uniref:D-xylose 1-dehydrogenase (NADP(+), D-xylono-1,5-lactone-forming) n=1 Tax=Paramarasmius palmivorus TaxID=297713 RepID=A0AAW0DXH4_9AGAR